MKKLVLILMVFFALSCNDGNINVPEFVFEDSLSSCTSTNDDKTTYVFYKTNENEALSVQISDLKEDYFTTEGIKDNISLEETGENTVTYRTFASNITGANYFCQNIPPTEPSLTNEWNGEGLLTLKTGETKDDQDGIPAENEDINGNGNLDDDDTDGDNIPNYLDIDDDNDGILTKNEISRDSDGNLVDTDGDKSPNYLDDDDDGDGIATRYEDTNGDGNLLNDDTDNDGNFDYLDSDNTNKSVSPIPPSPKTYNLIYTTTLIIENLNLTNTNSGESIRYDNYKLGEIEKIKENQPILTNKSK